MTREEVKGTLRMKRGTHVEYVDLHRFGSFILSLMDERDALRQQLAEAQKTSKRFPLQGAPSVPWEIVAPHEAQAQRNHRQSLSELAERKGLGPEEFWFLMNDLPLDLRNLKEAAVKGRALAESINKERDALREQLAEVTAARVEMQKTIDLLDDQLGEDSKQLTTAQETVRWLVEELNGLGQPGIAKDKREGYMLCYRLAMQLAGEAEAKLGRTEDDR